MQILGIVNEKQILPSRSPNVFVGAKSDIQLK